MRELRTRAAVSNPVRWSALGAGAFCLLSTLVVILASGAARAQVPQQPYQNPQFPNRNHPYNQRYQPGTMGRPIIGAPPQTIPSNPSGQQPGSDARVTLDIESTGPWWIGSTHVPMTATLTNLTQKPIVIADFNNAHYAAMYLTPKVTTSTGYIHGIDFPITTSTPDGPAVITLQNLSTYTFDLSGLIQQQYFLPVGKYTVTVDFHMTSPDMKAEAQADLEVRDVHNYLVSPIVDVKAVKGASDPAGLVANDVTGHVAIVTPYDGAYWAVYWRDENIPVKDPYAADRAMGFKDLPPAPAPVRSGMRYLTWLGPAAKDAAPQVTVTPSNDITVRFSAPTKRMTTVQVAQFMGPAKTLIDGNAPIVAKTPAPPAGQTSDASDADLIPHPRHIVPAQGSAGSVEEDEGNGDAGVVGVGF